MAKSFTNRNATNLKFSGNGVLAKLLALAQFAAKNFLPEALDDGCRKRLPPDGVRFFRAECLRS